MPHIITDNLPLIVLVVFVLGFLWLKRPDLSSAKARELVKGGARLVDVRSPAEFAMGHIEGAKNIPVGDISRRASEIGPQDSTVVLYCASGTRSAMARRALRAAGYERVYNLGAMSRW